MLRQVTPVRMDTSPGSVMMPCAVHLRPMRARKAGGALSRTFRFVALRHPLFTGIIVIGAACLIGWSLESGYQAARRLTMTPEQIRAEAQESARREAEYQEHQARTQQGENAARNADSRARAFQTAALCRQKSICTQYGQVRQECAIAGSFQTCVRVRMGDDNDAAAANCTNDGHVAFASKEPNAVDCFLTPSQ